MNRQVNLYEAKTQLSRLVDEAADGDTIIIAKDGKPMAKLGPVNEAARKQPRNGWYFSKTHDGMSLHYGDHSYKYRSVPNDGCQLRKIRN